MGWHHTEHSPGTENCLERWKFNNWVAACLRTRIRCDSPRKIPGRMSTHSYQVWLSEENPTSPKSKLPGVPHNADQILLLIQGFQGKTPIMTLSPRVPCYHSHRLRELSGPPGTAESSTSPWGPSGHIQEELQLLQSGGRGERTEWEGSAMGWAIATKCWEPTVAAT